jgi:hypothetical protein
VGSIRRQLNATPIMQTTANAIDLGTDESDGTTLIDPPKWARLSPKIQCGFLLAQGTLYVMLVQ